MLIVKLSNIEKWFGATPVLQGIDMTLDEKEKVGLVGRNGAGKSTLVKIITGELLPDKGEISFAKEKKIGYIAQDSGLNSHLSIWEEMLTPFQPLIEMEHRLRLLEEEMAQPEIYENESLFRQRTDEYTALRHRFEEEGGYAYPAKIRSLLTGLAFPEEMWNLEINTLSGGQKTRLAMVKLLLANPDLLILDEPTNYLDLATLSWLENYLHTYPGALLIISHDRYFLDQLVTRIEELEGGKLHSYVGNYTAYLAQKEERMRRQKEAFEAQQEEIKRMEEFIQKNIARASTTKRAQSRRKQLEKMERIVPPAAPPFLTPFQFEIEQMSGYEVLTVRDLTIGYPATDPVLPPKPLTKPFSFRIERGERIALVGPNGAGKSTLFLTLMGKLPPLSGEIIWGSQVKPAYYDQELQDLDEEKRVLDIIWNEHPLKTEREIRTLLGRFLFRGEEVEKKVAVLSGGERARLQLLKVLLERANLLLLDEPTNHLDIPSREALEEALLQYPGTLLFISHDRYFLNRIATRTLELSSEGITSFLGNYDYYMEKKEELAERKETPPEEGGKKEPSLPNPSYLLSKAEKKERRKWERQLAEVELRIDFLEKLIREKQEELLNPDIYSNYERSAKATQELEEYQEELNELLSLWEDLTQKLDGLEVE